MRKYRKKLKKGYCNNKILLYRKWKRSKIKPWKKWKQNHKQMLRSLNKKLLRKKQVSLHSESKRLALRSNFLKNNTVWKCLNKIWRTWRRSWLVKPMSWAKPKPQVQRAEEIWRAHWLKSEHRKRLRKIRWVMKSRPPKISSRKKRKRRTSLRSRSQISKLKKIQWANKSKSWQTSLPRRNQTTWLLRRNWRLKTPSSKRNRKHQKSALKMQCNSWSRKKAQRRKKWRPLNSNILRTLKLWKNFNLNSITSNPKRRKSTANWLRLLELLIKRPRRKRSLRNKFWSYNWDKLMM